MLMRQGGKSDETALAEARQLVSSLKKRPTQHNNSAANYFIGKCLLKNGNGAAIGYLMAAIKDDPLHIKAWVSLAQSVLTFAKNVGPNANSGAARRSCKL
jgi:hypothetical protein